VSIKSGKLQVFAVFGVGGGGGVGDGVSAAWVAHLGSSALGVGGVYGVLQSAGPLFFAFAGYARIATMGEEVRDPTHTSPARSRSRWPASARWC
jgi:amino acid transporter